MLHLSWCPEMKYPYLENTDNDTHKRNDFLWEEVILVQPKTKKTKRIAERFWSSVWVYSVNSLFS